MDLLILAFLIGVYIAFKIGQQSILFPMRKLLDEVARERGTTMEDLIENYFELIKVDSGERVINPDNEEVLTVERVGDQYFLYGNKLGFLAQGGTFQTAFERLRDRLPGGTFVINKSESKLSNAETELMVTAISSVFGEVKHETVE